MAQKSDIIAPPDQSPGRSNNDLHNNTEPCPDISTEFAGLSFRNPVVIAPGPLSGERGLVEKAIERGAGGVVLKTAVSPSLSLARSWPRPRYRLLQWDGKVKRSEWFTLYSYEQAYPGDIDDYCNMIRALLRDRGREAGIPIIASVMASSDEEWRELCLRTEDAGADAIELDISSPTTPPEEASGLLEAAILSLRETVRVPLIPKLAPDSVLLRLVRAVQKAGAGGVTINNRLQGIDIDIDRVEPVMHKSFGGFGGPWSRYLVLRNVAMVFRNEAVDISATGGAMDHVDVLKFVMAGARTVQVCSAILINGYDVIGEMVQGVKDYLSQRNLPRLSDLVGAAVKKILEPQEVERSQPVAAAVDRELCIGCGNCEAVCIYGAARVEGRKARVDRDLCTGCGLCAEVCRAKCIAFI